MSLAVHRTLVVCVALAACESPAATPETPVTPAARPAATAPVQAAPTPVPVDPGGPEEPLPSPPPVTPEIERAVVHSINALTIDLQRKLARQPGNLLFSGMSVATALAMVHAGSEGKTAKELADVLHIAGPADEIQTGEMQAGFAGLAARWARAGGEVSLVRASGLFGDEKSVLDPAYLDLTRTVFAAPFGPLDLVNDPTGARDRIDAWVRERTGERITGVVPAGAIDARTRLVLADAVDLRGEWLDPFDPAATTPTMFHGVEQKREVPMMHAVLRLRVAFGKAGKLRVLELPYKGGETSMVIVLPAKRDGLGEIEKFYDAEKLQGWLDAAKPTSVDLGLPRFTLDSSLDLAAVVHKLGAARLFDPKRAELGGMTGKTGEKLALSGVHHRARITVEERGTAADAAAIVVSVGTAPANPTPFLVDRPFLFYIRDVRTGALLFYGRVTDPT